MLSEIEEVGAYTDTGVLLRILLVRQGKILNWMYKVVKMKLK